MKNRVVISLIAISLLVLAATGLEAQCSLCASQIESARAGGSGIAESLNNGILYLLAVPFIAFGILAGAIIYRQRALKSSV